jgi:hypothetical protein
LDPEVPEQQEKWLNLYPELKDEPNRIFLENVKQQDNSDSCWPISTVLLSRNALIAVAVVLTGLMLLMSIYQAKNRALLYK